MFLLLTETTGEILQTTLHSYLKIAHRKNVSLVSNEPKVFPFNTALLAYLPCLAGLIKNNGYPSKNIHVRKKEKLKLF